MSGHKSWSEIKSERRFGHPWDLRRGDRIVSARTGNRCRACGSVSIRCKKPRGQKMICGRCGYPSTVRVKRRKKTKKGKREG